MAFKINKRVMNMAYGLGAAVVIIGALMKIIHKDLGPLTGSMLLTIGLVTEALIFALSAFDAPDEELDWTKAYPELAGGKATANKGKKGTDDTPEGVLTKKLDSLLKEAKIDGALVTSLGDSIRNLNSTASEMGGSQGASENATKLKEQMESLASNLSSLNGVYGGMLSAMNKN
jgi:gliding motility-associated protein GldL